MNQSLNRSGKRKKEIVTRSGKRKKEIVEIVTRSGKREMEMETRWRRDGDEGSNSKRRGRGGNEIRVFIFLLYSIGRSGLDSVQDVLDRCRTGPAQI